MTDLTKRAAAIALALAPAMLMLAQPCSALAAGHPAWGPYDTALALHFQDAAGKTKPYLFYDINEPFQMPSCKARLEYLTKFFYRKTRGDPEFEGKTAVKAECVRIEGFDLREY